MPTQGNALHQEGDRVRRVGTVPTMDDIRREVGSYMILGPGNAEIVDLMLAVALSQEVDRPLWLMVVAPPSSGKTEMLKLISTVTGYHHIPALSTRYLFSGHSDAQGGFMIREVRRKGLLAFPDFTTVLSMNPTARREVFNQLRVIHDGEAGRGTGIDTGGTRIWRGKVAVVACVTDTIERFREQSNDLGERFLYYVFHPRNPEYGELAGMLTSPSARKSVQAKVKQLVHRRKSAVASVQISGASGARLLAMAGFVGRARAPVVRERSTHEISHVHPAEMPYRVNGGLSTLYRCLFVIRDGDIDGSMRIITSVALSSVPASRVDVFRAISSGGRTVKSIAETVGLPETTVRRTVEDMEAQQLLESCPIDGSNARVFVVHPGFRAQCIAVGLLSESGGGQASSG